MKRIFTILPALVLVFSLTQCAKTELQQEGPEQEGNRMHVAFTTQDLTRSQIEDGIINLNFRWESGDRVWAYDGVKCLGSLDIRQTDVGKEVATFEGDITKPAGSTITFFFFGSGIEAPQTSATTVDYSAQDGTLAKLKTVLTASCEVSYTEGQTLFSGKFALPFAIGKFGFSSEDFSTGDNILVGGLAKCITVSEKGTVSYVVPSSGECSSKVSYTAGAPHYIVMPSSGTYDKVKFSNTAGKSKAFEKAIVNGSYYRADNLGSPIAVELAE